MIEPTSPKPSFTPPTGYEFIPNGLGGWTLGLITDPSPSADLVFPSPGDPGVGPAGQAGLFSPENMSPPSSSPSEPPEIPGESAGLAQGPIPSPSKPSLGDYYYGHNPPDIEGIGWAQVGHNEYGQPAFMAVPEGQPLGNSAMYPPNSATQPPGTAIGDPNYKPVRPFEPVKPQPDYLNSVADMLETGGAWPRPVDPWYGPQGPFGAQTPEAQMVGQIVDTPTIVEDPYTELVEVPAEKGGGGLSLPWNEGFAIFTILDQPSSLEGFPAPTSTSSEINNQLRGNPWTNAILTPGFQVMDGINAVGSVIFWLGPGNSPVTGGPPTGGIESGLINLIKNKFKRNRGGVAVTGSNPANLSPSSTSYSGPLGGP